jgi:hypothetical protein
VCAVEDRQEIYKKDELSPKREEQVQRLMKRFKLDGLQTIELLKELEQPLDF